MTSRDRGAHCACRLSVWPLAPWPARRGAQAAEQTYVMKITTPTLNDAPTPSGQNFAAAVEKDSGGRIKGEVYPASQLGPIPRQIEGIQFGAIQIAVIPSEFWVGVDERFEVIAAPGMVDSLEHGQRIAADPAVLKLMLSLGADKGLHGVGLFMAQPSTHFKDADSAPGRFQGHEAPDLCVAIPDRFLQAAWRHCGGDDAWATCMPALQQGTIDGSVAGMGPSPSCTS